MIAEIKKQLCNSEYWTDKTKENGKYIRDLICPVCGEPEAYAYSEKPFVILCNRHNNCGARTKTLPLFNITADIAEKYPPTKDDPHRPAKQFLRARGISEKVIQSSGVSYQKNIKRGGKDCGPAAMFQVATHDKGKSVYNGRLFNPPKGEGKTHNIGPVSGHHWKMPGMDYDPEKETFVVEGILDALSLTSMNKQAIAILGAGYKPERFDLSEFGNLVFAFDNDTAGRKATRQWMDHFDSQEKGPSVPVPKVSAILPVKCGGDWNDFICSSAPLEKALEDFKKNFEECQFQGRLALADSAFQYGQIYWDHRGFAPGLFSFQGCYYHSWIKPRNGDKSDELFVKNVSDFIVEVELFLRSDLDQEKPVFQHRLTVKPKGRASVSVTADAENLKSPDAMRTFFLKHAKALWTGQQEAVHGLIKLILGSKAPVVRQVECLGYDHKTSFHVLRDIAFDPKGKAIFPEKGLLNVGYGTYLRPPLQETIKPGVCNVSELYILITTAWGDNGAIALSFLLASIFVNQVKQKLGFFPFLSMFGDPQTGKSRLLTILNNMQALNEEGLVMTSANTKKGELRQLSNISGMIKGMVEGNSVDRSRFDFGSVLPLYNYGNALQVRALKTNDSRTHELPFYGTLAFVQNCEPFRQRAEKERVISLKFSTDTLNYNTKEAFDKLAGKKPDEFAGFLPELFKHREAIESQWYSEFQQACKDISGAIPDNRICENHAVPLGFHRLFCEFFKINHDSQPFIEKIGKAKIVSCQKRTLTPADHFFDALDSLPDQITGLGDIEFSESKNAFCFLKNGKFFFNRPGAEEAIRAAGITLDYPERLGKALQEHPAYIEANKSTRFGNGKTRKAWIFDVKKLKLAAE